MKPRVITKCVASRYAGRNERIVEFSFPDTDGPLGGLIRLYADDSGQCYLQLYRVDAAIRVSVQTEINGTPALEWNVPMRQWHCIECGHECSAPEALTFNYCPSCEKDGAFVQTEQAGLIEATGK